MPNHPMTSEQDDLQERLADFDLDGMTATRAQEIWDLIEHDSTAADNFFQVYTSRSGLNTRLGPDV